MNLTGISKEELLALIDEAVERKLAEWLVDSDGVEIRPEVRERLLAQQAAVKAGERGYSLDEALAQLDLDERAYSIRILDPALRDLERLDKPIARCVVQRVQWLAEHYEQITPEGLTGELAGLSKLRVGDYRVIYQVELPEQLLIVHQVGHRREIYR